MRHSALEGWHLAQHTTKSIILRAPQHNRYSNDSSCNLKFRDTLRKKNSLQNSLFFVAAEVVSHILSESISRWVGWP